MENETVVSKTDPDLMRIRLRKIAELVETETTGSVLGQEIWHVLNELPRGFVPKNPTLKNKAKAAFVKYTAREAGGKWKKLSENEQELWIGYVEGRVDYRTLLAVFGDKDA